MLQSRPEPWQGAQNPQVVSSAPENGTCVVTQTAGAVQVLLATPGAQTVSHCGALVISDRQDM